MDVVACVVSVKNTAIRDGRLHYADMVAIWPDYDRSLHHWMLKLTEEFDLTTPIDGQPLSIVPCLLADVEPSTIAAEWSPHSNANVDSSTTQEDTKEFKVVYSFEYLPAGLFNRIQVRLFAYGDASLIWQRGSMLAKNSHRALVRQLDMTRIEVRVRGLKPANIVYVVHETIEALVNESFAGIRYDYSFPCPECVEACTREPCMFSSSVLRKANELRAPFLQCQQLFHVVSIREMLAVMPMGDARLDLNLAYSLGDLRRLRKSFKYDVVFWFCGDDCDTTSTTNGISPLRLIEDVVRETKYNVWYTKRPQDEPFDQITYAVKEAKLVVLGISDRFAVDEKSIRVKITPYYFQ